MEETDALSKCSLSSLVPDGSDLVLYLGDFFEVSAPFVVGNLGFELINFLLVLPNGTWGQWIEVDWSRREEEH